MTKTQALAPYATKPDLRLVLARLLDQRELTQERNIPAFTIFLTPEERAEATILLSRLPPLHHCFWGGFAGAERQICAFLPDWMQEMQLWEDETSPLCALELRVPVQAQLSHRDYLGALMGLGLSREKFGDILVDEGGAQLLLLREQLPLLEDQWQTVGRYPIRLARLPFSALEVPQAQHSKLRETVASLRLDSVLAAGFSLSRSRAADLISAGRVLLNHRVCDKPDKEVLQGDVFSCRGLGKFVLCTIGGTSKKGRIRLDLERYE